MVRKKNFFIGFKDGMLLKIRESQTKYSNFERLFRRKCTGFAIFDTNCAGFARFEANLGAYLDERCQVLGARCQAQLSEGLRSLRRNSPPQVATPGASAPSLLNRDGSLWNAGMDAFTSRKMTVYATMSMKTRWLIANSGKLPETVYR